MNDWSDQHLLREYAEERAEGAFSELVRRHVDLVYSAALRMVRDSHLAEDVTQGVFVALARSAPQLTDRPVLSGWLHRTAQNLAANAVRSDVRRRNRESRYIETAMNELFSAEPDAIWEEVAPHLDAALGDLSEADRDALMLRYFEHKSAREMAQVLATTEEAAQKRVSRAIERLREALTKRGLAVGASGLVIALSANAVHAAPAALAATISVAAHLAAVTVAGTATATASATATKAIIMTTLQKTVIVAGLAAFAGFGIFEARQNAALRARTSAVQQQPPPQAEPDKDARLASLGGQVDSLLLEKSNLLYALEQANSDKARLQSEREQARHSAALFKELASQANSTGDNPTNQYPTPRHALTELGRQARIFAELSKDNSKLSEEEKSANDLARLNLAGRFFSLIKVLKEFEMDKAPGAEAAKDDPADNAACVLYGALDLNQEQFGAVYNVLERYHQEATERKLVGDNPALDAGTALKELDERAKAEIVAKLTSEQAAIFRELATHVKVSPTGGKFDINFSASN